MLGCMGTSRPLGCILVREYIHTCICTYIYMYLCISVSTYLYICIYTHMYVHANTTSGRIQRLFHMNCSPSRPWAGSAWLQHPDIWRGLALQLTICILLVSTLCADVYIYLGSLSIYTYVFICMYIYICIYFVLEKIFTTMCVHFLGQLQAKNNKKKNNTHTHKNTKQTSK